MSVLYSLLMLAVTVGVVVQINEDGITSPSSIFLFFIIGSFIFAAFIHPQEFGCILYGCVYLLVIPSMYLLLIIYSLCNVNNVSWGTRETAAPAAAPAPQKEKPAGVWSRVSGLFSRGTPSTAEGPAPQVDLEVVHTIREMDHKLNMLLNRQAHPAGEVPYGAGPYEAAYGQPRLPSSTAAPYSSARGPQDDDDWQCSIHVPSIVEEASGGEIGESPGWLTAPGGPECLRQATFTSLSSTETRFWEDLIEKYLKPLADNPQKKARVKEQLAELRNNVVLGFMMLNACFVLIVFFLQLRKDVIYVIWPWGQTSTGAALKLEPIAMVFLIVFVILLLTQFLGMIAHRWGTLALMLAITELPCCRSPQPVQGVAARGATMKGRSTRGAKLTPEEAVEFVRDLQRLEGSERAKEMSQTLQPEESSLPEMTSVGGKLDGAFARRFLALKSSQNDPYGTALYMSQIDLQVAVDHQGIIGQNGESSIEEESILQPGDNRSIFVDQHHIPQADMRVL